MTASMERLIATSLSLFTPMRSLYPLRCARHEHTYGMVYRHEPEHVHADGTRHSPRHVHGRQHSLGDPYRHKHGHVHAEGSHSGHAPAHKHDDHEHAGEVLALEARVLAKNDALAAKNLG
jgi:hydrogenase nickel incorporation protein HypB